jgi:hypothetical protein
MGHQQIAEIAIATKNLGERRIFSQAVEAIFLETERKEMAILDAPQQTLLAASKYGRRRGPRDDKAYGKFEIVIFL